MRRGEKSQHEMWPLAAALGGAARGREVGVVGADVVW